MEQALLPEGFHLRVRLDVCRLAAMLDGSQVRFVAAQPVAENSARTPLIYKEALRKKKVRRKVRRKICTT